MNPSATPENYTTLTDVTPLPSSDRGPCHVECTCQAFGATALAVLEALLWAFHNAKSGLCFPSYERIAEAAHCARSTAAEAIRALEDAGILSWVQRIKRVREACRDLLGDNGWRWRVLRTSNSYAFTYPSPAADPSNSSKSEKPTGTPDQGSFSSFMAAFGGERTARSGRKEAWRGEGGRPGGEKQNTGRQ
jgi:hypothetical protein